jgi:hypothetical protein
MHHRRNVVDQSLCIVIELANDVLNDLVLDEDDLEYFLDIVKDIDEGH